MRIKDLRSQAIWLISSNLFLEVCGLILVFSYSQTLGKVIGLSIVCIGFVAQVAALFKLQREEKVDLISAKGKQLLDDPPILSISELLKLENDRGTSSGGARMGSK